MEEIVFEEAQARVGTVARKWTLDRLIAVGGMAAVYAATHRNGHRVAVKVLHSPYAAMAEAKERFMREGYVANKVGHPGALAVNDDDELDDGTPFLVMELLSGISLEERLDRKPPLSVAELLIVADHILDVLGAAHGRGIVHRDIKPANVFLTQEGAVMLLDFGLARVLDGPAQWSLTRTGTVIGTASYMSPEQARGKSGDIDHRSDIYAVGALIFRALSGRNVHEADTPVDRMLAAMSQPARSLADVTERAAPELIALVDGALAFDRNERWADAEAMRKALRKAYLVYTRRPSSTPRSADRAAAAKAGPSGLDAAPTGETIQVDLDDDNSETRR